LLPAEEKRTEAGLKRNPGQKANSAIERSLCLI